MCSTICHLKGIVYYFAFLLLPVYLGASTPPVLGEELNLYVDFNDCASFGGGSNADYSEFSATPVISADCVNMRLMEGHVYRSNPDINKHSCAPGINNSIAMCISAMDGCEYDSTSDMALKFNVQISPGTNGLGILSEVSFYSRAPEQFQFIEGPTGDNNYPTLYTLRVLVDSTEIYRAEDMPLSNNWTQEVYDFNSNPDFSVTENTIFRFEILPYCLAGVASTVHAWDIDDLLIKGACTRLDGGVISTEESTRICTRPDSESTITFEVENAEGDSTVWLAVNGSGNIEFLSSDPILDFSNSGIGLFSVYHLVYEGQIEGLTVGEAFNAISGCFEFSNPIGINHLRVNGGELLTEDQSDSVDFCTGDGLPDIISTVLNNHQGSNTSYIITDSDSTVLEIRDDGDFDFEGTPTGTCLMFALAHESSNTGLDIGDNLDDLEDCFHLSNAITISRTFVDGGAIDIAGSTFMSICVDEDMPVDVNLTGGAGTQGAWIITDLDGNILETPSAPPFDLSSLSVTECQIYHIGYDGISNLGVGQNIDDLEGCFDLSNAIDLDKVTVNGGNLMLMDGTDQITICADDGESDAFNILLMNAIGDSSNWVVTDPMGDIIDIPTNPPFDFEGSPAGICNLFRISHSGGLMGFEVGNNLTDIMGCFALSNAIVVTKLTGMDCPDNCVAEGGFIDLFNNNLCVGDGVPDIMDADVAGAVGNFSTFILTDPDSLIISVYDTLPVDLDGLEEGEFFFWHLSSDSMLVVDSSLIHINDIDLECFDLSEPAGFTTTFNNAGSVSLIDGTTDISICLTDTLSDILEFSNSSTANNLYQFVVTDTSNIILGLPDSTLVDFSGAGPGICLVWGVSYTGSFLPMLGDTLGNEPATGFCFDISDNAVQVSRDTIDGACVMEECLVDGGSLDLFDNDVCVGDGVPDLVDGDVFGAVGDYQAFVITDSDSLILAVVHDLPIDLDGSGPGTCLFWHLSANDTLVLNQGMHIDNIMGCHDLSAPASVVRTDNNAGSVSLIDSTDMITVCVSDSISDVLTFINTSTSGNNYQYVITDSLDIILSIPDTSVIDFSLAPPGVCYVYGVSYTGTFLPMPGDTLSNVPVTNECFDISDNFVIVTRVSGTDCPDDCMVDGGALDLFDNTVCVGDGVADLVDGDVTGAVGDYFVFLITGVDSLILGISNTLPINFESAGPGACLIWHLAAMDTIPINMGDNVNNIGGCYDLAEPQQVTRIENNAGLVSLDGGATDITICAGDGSADELTFENSSNSGNSYQYVITDTMNQILALPPGNTFDFENAGVGICRVWGVSYTGSFLLMVGDSLEVAPSTDDCFDISDNFIEVERVDSGPLCMTTTSPALSIVYNRISEWMQVFDIKNVSNDTIDVSDYWVCQGPGNYNRIGDVIIECGPGTLMAPGDVIGLNISMDNDDGELGLYTTDDFSNSDAIIHYVEWGSSGHARSGVAIAAGLWTAGDFVPAITAQGSAYFDGDGISSADWSEGPSIWCGSQPTIVFNRVGNTSQVIDIKNISNDTINVADLWICELGNYNQIRDLVIECGGDTIMAPGDIIGLNVNVADADGELGLYTSAQFTNPAAIIDYVEWGSSGHLRSSVAVNAGIWTTGDFVPAITPGNSIYYDDAGDSSSDWSESGTNLCSDFRPAVGEEIEFKIFPVPAVDHITLDVIQLPGDHAEISVYDSFGKMVSHEVFENIGQAPLQMYLPDLAMGTYFIRMKSHTQVKTRKFLISN